MSNEDDRGDGPRRWAELRFSVVGGLLAAPPPPGELQAELEKQAAKTWKHPITGAPKQFAFSTVERWYYVAHNEVKDRVAALRRKVRSDRGRQPAMGDALRRALVAQYQDHRAWSYQLHYDNLAALIAQEPSLGPRPCYATVRRFMKANGLYRSRRLRQIRTTAGAQQAQQRLEQFEVRSYETTHVHGLWHLDFHVGSRKVLQPEGRYATAHLLGILDDRSRLACHLQWYLAETTENLVHGLSQALQKRGLCGALMTDRGAAMMAAETTQGLARLAILHEPTLPYSPYQNAKQESFWTQVEGRLMPMLEGCPDLTLTQLNEATQAWVEFEYNRKIHSEIGMAPLTRYLAGPSVGRPCPASEALRQAFTVEQRRSQRRSDGTLSLAGSRFEVSSRFRHLRRLTVRYASWDLSFVLLVDPGTGLVLDRLYPLDKAANADGQRRRLAPGPLAADGLDTGRATAPDPRPSGMAPLLRQLLADYAATGRPPAYLPKDEPTPAARSAPLGEDHPTAPDEDEEDER
jgi:transposase InsO family protein